MYDDLLGKRKKKAPCGIYPDDCTDHKCHKCFDEVELHIQDCDWDDENKEVIVKKEYVFKWEDIPQLSTNEAWKCEHCGDWFTDGEERCGDCD